MWEGRFFVIFNGQFAKNGFLSDNKSVILNILEIIVGALLIGVILLQVQGSGLSASFGGSGESFRTKQSMEKLLVYATIALSVLFGFLSILLLIPR